MSSHELDLRGIKFDVVKPTDLPFDASTWAECHEVGMAAFKNSICRPDYDIQQFMGSLNRFTKDHINPQSMVDAGRLNPQDLSRPYLVVAYASPESPEEKIVGFAYSADAVSGNDATLRQVKALTLVKRYRWLEKIAVHPDYQGRGIAQALGYVTFRQALPLQPASAYTWPNESRGGYNLLEQWDLRDDGGKQTVEPFGPYAVSTVVQHRHIAKSARGVSRRIAAQNGNDPIFSELKARFSFLGKNIGDIDQNIMINLGRNPLGY